MSPKYWTGVIIGMLAVFGAGMLVARGIERGKNLVTANFPAALPLLNAGFRVDGDRVGDLQRLQFMRSQPGRVDSAVLTVKLSSTDAGANLTHCTLRVVNHNQTFGGGTRFQCVSGSDSAVLHLVRFGHVVLLPGNQVLPLFISGDMLDQAREHAYRGTGGDVGDVDIEHHDGNLSLTVNNHELVHISGDSAGGSVVIRDANGHPIVEINGDSNGGSVKIHDADGKTRLDVHGTSPKRDSD